MRYIIPLVNGSYTEGDSAIVTEGTRNDSGTHKVIVAVNGAPQGGKITIQSKAAGRSNWAEVDYTMLTDVNPQTIEYTGEISQYRFIVEGVSGSGSVIVSDTEEGEAITPFGMFGATGGMTPGEVGGSISQGKSATIPAGFNWPELLPDVIAYKSGNSYDCNIKPEDLIDFSQFTNIQYVDINRPDSSGDGTSWATAEKGIEAAIVNANSSGLPTTILVKGGVYPRVYGFGSSATTLTVPISIQAVYGDVLTGPFDFLTYSQNATYSTVWEVARSSVQQVIDPTIIDDNGNAKRLVGVSSVVECSTTAGSFYTDNTTLYVHTYTSNPATKENALAVLTARSCEIYAGNNDVYIKGVKTIGGSLGGFKIRDGSTNKVVLDNCESAYALSGVFGSETEIDGFVVLDCGLFAAFNSKANSNSKDGFNFHANSGVVPSALLVNCSGTLNGDYGIAASCNGVTAHDGVKCIDIGGDWRGSVGTNAGHVSDGTQVWHFGSIAGDSAGDIYNGGSIDYGAFGVWSGAAEMWLDSCRSVGSIIGVKASGTAKAYIRDFSGTGSLDGNVENY